MKQISSQELSERLTTDSAREAFSKINSICPSWETDERDGNVHLRPNRIDTRDRSGTFPMLVPLRKGCGASFDEALLQYSQRLMSMAKTGAVVVVGGDTVQRQEYVLDKSNDTFVPRPKR